MHNQVTCTSWLALCVRVVFSAAKRDVLAEVDFQKVELRAKIVRLWPPVQPWRG